MNVVVITDGRGKLLYDMLASATKIDGQFDRWIGVNDSGDPEYARWLDVEFPHIEWSHHPERQGLAAAIRDAWGRVDADYVLHLEDDVYFPHHLNVYDWVAPFAHNPELAQVCLMRGPQAPHEHDRGGILGCVGQVTYIRCGASRWVEQSHLFSLQPNIYPRWVVDVGWPEHGGEREFTDRLLFNRPDTRFAYLGWGEPQYEHRGYGQRQAGWFV